jgi:hypothetical protein
MLLQFTVSNFLSFDEEATFSMVPDKGDDRHPNHVLRVANKKDGASLRAAAIYGANGAGKSNLVKAILFARDLIVEGTRGNQAIPVSPFRLRIADRPSGFEFIFHHLGFTYSYGFRADTDRITEEWLYATSDTPRSREVILFERTTNQAGETTIEFGAAFKHGEKAGQFHEFVARGTRQNQLFLTEAVDRNVDVVRPVSAWFRDVLTLVPAEGRHIHLELLTRWNAKFTDFVSALMRDSGTGVIEVRPTEVPTDLQDVLANLPAEERKAVAEKVAQLRDEEAISVVQSSGSRKWLMRSAPGELVEVQIRTVHRSADGSDVEFSPDMESDGTRRLTNLAPVLFSMTGGTDKVVIIDELDRRLHPLLSRSFVEAALGCGSGRNQLIFTTHDTNLLDLDLLRRDEIWFIEKDEIGASRMYSLAEFNIRPDLKVGKGYLNGRFGAIPFLGDACRLGWTDEARSEGSEAERPVLTAAT